MEKDVEINGDLIHLNNITRVEVIDELGRSYGKWNKDFHVKLSIQDDGKTLKIFLVKKIEKIK